MCIDNSPKSRIGAEAAGGGVGGGIAQTAVLKQDIRNLIQAVKVMEKERDTYFQYSRNMSCWFRRRSSWIRKLRRMRKGWISALGYNRSYGDMSSSLPTFPFFATNLERRLVTDSFFSQKPPKSKAAPQEKTWRPSKAILSLLPSLLHRTSITLMAPLYISHFPQSCCTPLLPSAISRSAMFDTA